MFEEGWRFFPAEEVFDVGKGVGLILSCTVENVFYLDLACIIWHSEASDEAEVGIEVVVVKSADRCICVLMFADEDDIGGAGGYEELAASQSRFTLELYIETTYLCCFLDTCVNLYESYFFSCNDLSSGDTAPISACELGICRILWPCGRMVD